MKNSILSAIIGLTILALNGCAPVKFYSNSALTESTGLKYYTVIKEGLGSRKVDLKLTDGSINTFGLTSDPKIAETIEALSSLISKGASAVTDLSTLKNIQPAAASSTITELYEFLMVNGVTSVKKIEIK